MFNDFPCLQKLNPRFRDKRVTFSYSFCQIQKQRICLACIYIFEIRYHFQEQDYKNTNVRILNNVNFSFTIHVIYLRVSFKTMVMHLNV